MPDLNNWLNAIIGPVNETIEGIMVPQPSDYRRMNPSFPLSFGNRTGQTAVGKPGAPTATQQILQGLLTALGGISPGRGLPTGSSFPMSRQMPPGYNRNYINREPGTSGAIPEPDFIGLPSTGERLRGSGNPHEMTWLANDSHAGFANPHWQRIFRNMPDFPQSGKGPRTPSIHEQLVATVQRIEDNYRRLDNPNLTQGDRFAIGDIIRADQRLYNEMLPAWRMENIDQHRPHVNLIDRDFRPRTYGMQQWLGGRRTGSQNRQNPDTLKGPDDLRNSRDIDALVRNHYDFRAPSQNQMRTFMSREMGYDLISRRTAGSGTVYQHYLDRQPNLPGLTRNNYPQLPPFNRYELRYADHPGASYSRSSNSSVAPVTTIRTDPQYIVRNNVTTARGPSTFELIRNMVRSRHGLPITRIPSRPTPPSPDQLNFFDLLGGQ